MDPLYRVLYVDDEPDLLEIARLFLEHSGEFQVGISNSAQDALDGEDISTYDAIVSDYQMPEMDGIAFLKLVREQFGDIPFILFTGKGREEVVIDAINNGADFYIQKGGDPKVQFAELAHKIRQAVKRSQAERLLRDSERRLADLIAFLPDATFAIEKAGTVIAWNRAIEEMTGVPAEKMLGKGKYAYAVPFYGCERPILIDLIDEPDEKIAQFYSNVYRTGLSLTAETDLPTPKGQRIAVLVKVSHLYNEKGEIIGAIESIRDITGRKLLERDLERNHGELQASFAQLAAAEEELRTQYKELAEREQLIRTNEQRLIMAQEIGHSGSWEYDVVADRVWGTAEAHHIFGFEPVAGDLPLDDIEACIPERERVHRALIDLITKGQAYNLEYAINPADGSPPRMIHSVARLERDAGGTPVRVAGIIQDITELKQAEDALRESEERFRGMAERSSDLIFILDKEMSPTYVSPSARTILGYDPAEMVGKPAAFAAATIFSLSGPGFMKGMEENLSGKSVENFEIRLKRKDGKVISVNVHAVPILESGAFVGAQVSMRDITDKKLAEEALRESEEKFRSFVESSSDILYSMTPDGIVTYISPRWSECTGHDPHDIIGKPFETVVSSEDRPACREFLQHVLVTGERRREIEYRVRRKDGTSQWHSATASPVRDDAGSIISIVGSIRDITKQKNVEEWLRESEEKFRSLVETSPNMIWEIDTTGKFRYMSPIVQNVMGYTQEEVIGRSITDLVTEQNRPLAMNELTKLLSSDVLPSPIEVPARHRNGSELVLEIRPWRLIDHDGRLKGLRGVAVDITGRKKSEEALRMSREQLAEAMDIAHLVNWEYDTQTDLFTFDDRFYALYGTTTEREGGPKMSSETYAREFVHPDDRYMVAREVEKALQATDPMFMSQVEHRIIRRDGAVRYIVVRIRITKNAEGRTIKTHGANQDITERKKIEEALRSANRQLSLLTGITRHDVINKITVILGYLEIAEMHTTDPTQLAYIRRMRSATAAIQSQIQFTRTYQDLGTQEPQWTDLATTLRRLTFPATIVLRADVKGVSLYADPILEKVFLNLLDNSIRHGDHVTEIRVSSHQAGDELTIVWEDNGAGIPANEKEKIFERGFGKNTGLGLFLVQEILALTGITIKETGEPGKGALFEITVPKDHYRVIPQ